MDGAIYDCVKKDGHVDTVFVCTEGIHVRMDHKDECKNDKPDPEIMIIGECDGTCLRSKTFCEVTIELPKLMVAIGNYKLRR